MAGNRTLLKIFLLVILYIAVFLFILFYPRIFNKEYVTGNYCGLPLGKSWKKYDDSFLKLDARSAISIEYENGLHHILYQKDSDKKLPIASIVKLLTGLVAVKEYDLDQKVIFSQESIDIPETTGLFEADQEFKLRDLLNSMLIESSNDAAWEISKIRGKDIFIYLMNQKAKDLRMHDSLFFDPTGLDPNYPEKNINFSTARDLTKLAIGILKEQELVKILGKNQANIYQSNGIFHHTAFSTNKMVFDYDTPVIAGKTGSTPLAEECLLIIARHPKYPNAYIINVVLGSEKRYEDMDNLMNWINNNYIRL
ncbi:MAG: serine hydrolase [Candidatus Pacebacteria bacterium]|nr:serine hydrolase [Candidatus Paceibacterota bacterium]